MSTWSPQEQHLTDLLNVLRMSGTADSALQRRILQHLEGLNSVADFNCYLCFILCDLETETEQVRATAGLHMKNNLLRFPPSSPDIAFYIQNTLLRRLLQNPLSSKILRSTVSTCVASLSQLRPRLSDWPDLIPSLLTGAAADPTHGEVVLVGAFDTLDKIFEDANDRFDEQLWQNHGERLLHSILAALHHPVEEARVLALSCFNHLMAMQAAPFLQVLPTFVQALFQLASDTSLEVRKRLCHGLVNVWECRADILLPSLPQIIEYMIASCQVEDESVALEASEFWLSISESPEAQPYLRNVLPRLIPVLLKNMVYSEMDIAILDNEDEDSGSKPDRAEDINPTNFHHAARSQGGAPTTNEEQEDGDDDDEDEDEDGYEWNLRKCSASALDTLASTFENDILTTLLPLLQMYLTSDSWEVRECGILALGAISEGCLAGVAPHLGQLYPFLLNNLSHQKALVRSITCWTLSRYVSWASQPDVSPTFFQSLIQGLMERILDTSKRVQEAACSAFSVLEEECIDKLVPILEPIINQLALAFQRYQAKNTLILYDTLCTLAENVGSEMNRPSIISTIMPPLVQRWNALGNDSKDLVPLLECLGSLAHAMGPGFEQFAPHIYPRCLQIIQENQTTAAIEYETSQTVGIEKDIIVTAIDLISSLIEGLKGSMESLIGGSNIFHLLFDAMTDDTSPDCRQSAFALIGDLARYAFPHLRSYLQQYFPVMLQNMENTQHVAVCNNSIWASGEIAVVLGDRMAPVIPAIMNKIVPFYQTPNLSRHLMENVSITIGRFGLAAPQVISPHLPHFFGPWCSSIRGVLDEREKSQAMRGMLEMVSLNPAVIVPHFVSFCDVVLSWSTIPADINQVLASLLTRFRASFAEPDWVAFAANIPQGLRELLAQRYGL